MTEQHPDGTTHAAGVFRIHRNSTTTPPSTGNFRQGTKKPSDAKHPKAISQKRWSWRESNPRPNRETIRFLHAYSGLQFSCRRKTRTTQRRPYPLKFHHARGAGRDYSRFNRTAGSECFGTTASGRCLVLSPCDGIEPVIYCASIRQRERICFRQINL